MNPKIVFSWQGDGPEWSPKESRSFNVSPARVSLAISTLVINHS
jgi:hypothetical protein